MRHHFNGSAINISANTTKKHALKVIHDYTIEIISYLSYKKTQLVVKRYCNI